VHIKKTVCQTGLLSADAISAYNRPPNAVPHLATANTCHPLRTVTFDCFAPYEYLYLLAYLSSWILGIQPLSIFALKDKLERFF